MTFFSPSLCAELNKLGLASDSGKWHVRMNENDPWQLSHHDWNHRTVSETFEIYPAFSASDIILSKENLIKLFDTYPLEFAIESEKLLRIHLSGQSIEKELERLLEERV